VRGLVAFGVLACRIAALILGCRRSPPTGPPPVPLLSGTVSQTFRERKGLFYQGRISAPDLATEAYERLMIHAWAESYHEEV
jgi:hypothetical protein